MLLDLMAALEVLPEETIMVGDTEYDMEMATNAGDDLCVHREHGSGESCPFSAPPPPGLHSHKWKQD